MFSLLSYIVLGLGALRALAYDNSRSDNIVAYYGQNSYGATHGSDTANWQKRLSSYCNDDSIDAFPIAFLHIFFSTGGLPSIDLSSTCSTSSNSVFPGTNLPDCSFLAADIQTCQAKGKIVTISLGGATGAATFSSDSQAQTFADTVWNLFLGGSSSTRPFGSAVLDGVDLDIEGGSSTGFAAFANRIRSHYNGASKKYYLTAAPQCVFPDAYLGSVINSVSFDAIYVQFYNNWCGLQNFGNANAWNFGTWDNWAKTTSPNKNVKIFIGAPASSTAAGSGYVDANTLANIAKSTKAQYSSFGGVMFWDASQAYANGRIDTAIKNAIRGGGSNPTTNPPATTPTTTPKPTTTPPTTGSCAGVSAWSSTGTYVGGNKVTYNGHLWTAGWWTYGDTPGGAAGVWVDNGACKSKIAGRELTATAAAAAPTASAAFEAIRIEAVAAKFNVTVAEVKENQAPARRSRVFRA